MRGTTPLAVSSLALLLTGCSGGVRLTSVPVGCMPTTSIAVTYTPGDEATITPVPDCIDVTAGSTVTLTFSPTPELEDASTRYRLVLGNGWLRGKNELPAQPDRIVLTVPLDAGVGEGAPESDREDYKYIIKIKKTGKLDPRIVVQ